MNWSVWNRIERNASKAILLFVLSFFVLSLFLFVFLSQKRDINRLGEKVDSLRVRIQEDSLRLEGLQNIVQSMNYVYLPKWLYFCEERIPLENPRVRGKISDVVKSLISSNVGRKRVVEYITRAEKYFPYIDSVFTADSLCTDFKYLTWAESELKRDAVSRAGAVGPWQFMPTTARLFGLKRDGLRDERKDFYKSTVAAARYLRKSFQRFGKSLLAAAAFNAGDPSVSFAVREAGDSSFFNLVFYARDSKGNIKGYNTETAGYIPMVLAIKIIMENPEWYPWAVAQESEPDFEMIVYKTSRDKRITVVARELRVSPADLQQYNPQFTKGIIPAGKWTLEVPRRKPADSVQLIKPEK